MNRTGRLLFPSLRWHAHTGFEHERDTIELALRVGVGGFTIFGGDADAVLALTTSLRARSHLPLLIASDLERGAGQQFPQATQLPPLAAIGSLDDLTVTRRAGALTASEALSLGINWIFAPVADVDLEPRNPIVGTRSFGTQPERVAAHVAAWIAGAHSAGALCCAKHFPGHGRTVEDSHTVLPRVRAARAQLDDDLQPFRAAIAAGVDALMSAHVVYDAFDSTTAATLSWRVLTDLARAELNHEGLIVSDAINMAGMLQAAQGSETRGAVAALNAGCDGLLYPADLAALAAALEQALGGELNAVRVEQALGRIDAAARRAHSARASSWGAPQDRAWADDIAQQTLVVSRGAPRAATRIALLTIDDDVGGPFAPPARDVFAQTLRDAGIDVTDADDVNHDVARVVTIYADIRAWKGPPGLSARAAAAARSALAARPDATVAFFGHPRLTESVPGEHLLAAWGGEAIMQRAAARWLAATN